MQVIEKTDSAERAETTRLTHAARASPRPGVPPVAQFISPVVYPDPSKLVPSGSVTGSNDPVMPANESHSSRGMAKLMR